MHPSSHQMRPFMTTIWPTFGQCSQQIDTFWWLTWLVCMPFMKWIEWSVLKIMVWNRPLAAILRPPEDKTLSDVAKMWLISEDSLNKYDKTDVERRQTLGHPSSINPYMLNHVPQQSPLILSVHEAIQISFSYHLPCQGSRNCQKSDVSNHSFVDMVQSTFQYCPSI